jgi:hypothetical protein
VGYIKAVRPRHPQPDWNALNHTITLVVGKAVLGSALVLGFAAAPHGTAHAAPVGVDVYAYEVGDDNADGRIDEDESGWDCATMGNRICGPGAVGSIGDLTYCPTDGVWSREWHDGR